MKRSHLLDELERFFIRSRRVTSDNSYVYPSDDKLAESVLTIIEEFGMAPGAGANEWEQE